MNLETVIQVWYQWGHFAALAVASVAAFWIFYDAARRGVRATLPKVLAIIGIVLVLPSFVLWGFPALASGNLAAAVSIVAYVGLGATALALFSLFLYVISSRPGFGRTCPRCGQPQHESWTHCPYCAVQQARQANRVAVSPPPAPSPPPLSSPPPAPPSPPMPVAMDVPLPADVPSVQAEKTELLQAAQPGELAWLVFVSGVHAGKEFRLGEETTIGRDPANNDIVIDDGAISRQHAKVRLEDDQFVIYDLASTGGTFVEDKETGEWVEAHKYTLQDGDRIRMGRETIGFMHIVGEHGGDG